MVNQNADAFVIQYGVGDEEFDIDLSDPSYEKQVCAAASRFYSLRRKKKSGPKAQPTKCGYCKELLPSKRKYLDHLIVCVARDGH